MPATRFRAPPGEALRIAPLDLLTAVFHRPSGSTHLLAAPAPEILRALAGEWRTLNELLAMLGREYDMVDPDQDALAARVGELVAAGLVEAE